MPTSPATDMLSPAAPQDTSLFSSPRASGSIRTVLFYLSRILWKHPTFFFLSFFFFFCFDTLELTPVRLKLSFSLTVLPNEVDMSSPLMYGTPSSRVEGTPRSSVRGTPARQRPDLGSVRKAPQVDLHSEPVSGGVQNIQRISETVYCNRLNQYEWFPWNCSI